MEGVGKGVEKTHYADEKLISTNRSSQTLEHKEVNLNFYSYLELIGSNQNDKNKKSTPKERVMKYRSK